MIKPFIKKVCACCICFIPTLYRQHSRHFYNEESILGKGRFGNVMLAIDKQTQQKVAIKRINLNTFRKKHKHRSAYNEIIILLKLEHPHIAKLIDSYEHRHTLHIILDYCEGEELFFTIQRCGAMPYTQALPLFKSMLSTLRYLHSRQVVHRDIKLENLIYCASTHTIKWIDFDLAKYCPFPEELEKLTTSVGTLLYCAPEILAPIVQYNGKHIDVWSLGVVFYTTLCGQLPFLTRDAKQLYYELQNGLNVFANDFKQKNMRAQYVIQHMLLVNHKERFTVDQCIEYLDE